jgi:hypothetical protein
MKSKYPEKGKNGQDYQDDYYRTYDPDFGFFVSSEL